MKTFIDPPQEAWKDLCKRPQLELAFLESSVRNILNRVKKSGDEALRALSLEFDKVHLNDLKVTQQEINDAIAALNPTLKSAIIIAAANIEKFHLAQQRDPIEVETMPGVTCWRKALPIEAVGLYIPGGSAPLFSTVLMLGLPAKLAGCKEVILCTPPNKQGKISDAILFAAQLVGVTSIYKVGGAQAIAALAYGTETIPAVNKIFGPGNQFVTQAKQLVLQEGVSIDIPAGPSELLILADESANPSFLAADLLSQAEHGADSQVVLVCTSKKILESVSLEIDIRVQTLPRRELAIQALENSFFVYLKSLREAIAFANAYAPEHLIINTQSSEDVATQIVNAGSVFVGQYSTESAGDYASGTNHTLPTNGYARAYSGVSLESFQKQITIQKITKEGLEALGPVVIEMAEAEQLSAHAEAIKVRLGQ